jgi:hypothetical protein
MRTFLSGFYPTIRIYTILRYCICQHSVKFLRGYWYGTVLVMVLTTLKIRIFSEGCQQVPVPSLCAISYWISTLWGTKQGVRVLDKFKRHFHKVPVPNNTVSLKKFPFGPKIQAVADISITFRGSPPTYSLPVSTTRYPVPYRLSRRATSLCLLWH